MCKLRARPFIILMLPVKSLSAHLYNRSKWRSGEKEAYPQKICLRLHIQDKPRLVDIGTRMHKETLIALSPYGCDNTVPTSFGGGVYG